MFVVSRRVDAFVPTLGKLGLAGKLTSTPHAEFTRITGDTAAAAIRVAGIEVDAAAAALFQALGTFKLAFARGTNVSRCAEFWADTAMLGIAHKIHTNPIAVRQTFLAFQCTESA
jgi:hypothetical protein